MYGWKISVWRETWDSHSGNTNENHDKIPIHTLECLKLKRPGICKDVEAPQFLYMAGGDEKWCKHFGEQFGGFFFFLKLNILLSFDSNIPLVCIYSRQKKA